MPPNECSRKFLKSIQYYVILHFYCISFFLNMYGLEVYVPIRNLGDSEMYRDLKYKAIVTEQIVMGI